MPAIALMQKPAITNGDKHRKISTCLSNVCRATAKIVLQEYQDGEDQMLLGIKFKASNTIMKKTAKEILRDKSLFCSLSAKDARMVVYIAAEENQLLDL